MDNVDKTSFLKELEFYSHLLKKHQALKKEKDLKSTITHQARINQQHNKPKSIHNYKIVKNQNNSGSCLPQKYSFKKPSQLDIANQNKRNRSYNERQNCNFKYSSSKNKILNHAYSVVNSKNSNNHVSIMNAKSISNSKIKPVKGTSPSGSGKLTYNAKDFIKEVESLTELLKKKNSGSSLKMSSSKLTFGNVPQNKQFSNKKDPNISFDNIKLMKKETTFSKENDLIKMPLKLPASVNYVNRRKYFINSNDTNNVLQQKNLDVNKSIYKKDNVKHSLNRSTTASLKIIKVVDESNNLFQKNSKHPSRKVIFSNSKNLPQELSTSDRASIFQTKLLSPCTQKLVMKSHTSNKIIPSTRKVFKKSPLANKMKSPLCFKIKTSNTVKVPKIVKLKQTNTVYTKINKHLTPPNKKIPRRHLILKSSSKKGKKKVNSKYKVINKTLTPNLSKKSANLLCTSVDKKKSSLSTDCDTFLEALNNSAVEKLEKNLLAISSELTAPPLTHKNKDHDSKISQHLLAKVNSKIGNKRTLFKKSKSRISKYKIINSNVSSKCCIKNMQSVHMVPFRKEKAVLVRRLFKSKNVIINKNVSPTNHSAKMIKSKYLSLNKRKASNWQYMYPVVSQNTKFKGTRLHLKQKKFKTNAVLMYNSRLIRKGNYGYETHKHIYKNNKRLMKNKRNRYIHSPVVFIRGARYAKNLNGKTLRKLPIKGYTTKNFQRANTKWMKRMPENFIFKSSPVSTNLASRAVHRSISRILTASSKKKISKVNTYCMFYNRFGRCNRGVKCTYIHDPSKIAVCTRFLRGTCKIDGCPFSHEIDPGKMAICSFFLVGQCDKENCHYRHEKLSPNAVLCKDFVQGYCPYGKECKKAHILICPKYMQSECDKGSSCAFPHPPQKAKKNIQKEVEDEESKPADVLLEKVLRYFQQGGDSENVLDGNSTTNLFVPKQRKLEEQPSFIPLSDSTAVIIKEKQSKNVRVYP